MQTKSKLRLITEKAKRHQTLKFTSLMHLINEELLRECHKKLRKNAACGIDGVTVEVYGKELALNLEKLIERLKSKDYKPSPVRRVYIPKPGKKEMRPLGIPTVEDKLVQMAVKIILERVYEPLFKDNSHGFRPKRSCHTAIRQLDKAVMKCPTNYIIEVDIAKFFDTVNHYWLLRCLEERIKDPNFLWLVRKFLKAGIMELGQWRISERGTPQGGVVSPILANIYLHYVLDLWFEKRIKLKAKGQMQLIRHCDDFVIPCESSRDANGFLEELAERLAKFDLKISQEKTKIIKFGRQVWKTAQRTGNKVETFDFLGFTHYCTASRKGWFTIGHKTSMKSLSKGLKAVNEWVRRIRCTCPLKEWWQSLREKIIGHYAYYSVNGNMRWLRKYSYGVRRIVYKWINRRSQKKSMNWNMFNKYLSRHPLPAPRIIHQVWS